MTTLLRAVDGSRGQQAGAVGRRRAATLHATCTKEAHAAPAIRASSRGSPRRTSALLWRVAVSSAPPCSPLQRFASPPARAAPERARTRALLCRVSRWHQRRARRAAGCAAAAASPPLRRWPPGRPLSPRLASSLAQPTSSARRRCTSWRRWTRPGLLPSVPCSAQCSRWRRCSSSSGAFFRAALTAHLADAARACSIVMTWYPNIKDDAFPWVIVYAPTEPLLAPTRKIITPVGCALVRRRRADDVR